MTDQTASSDLGVLLFVYAFLGGNFFFEILEHIP